MLLPAGVHIIPHVISGGDAANAAVATVKVDAADVIFINDAPIPGGRLGQGLKRFLSAGGGLLIVAADRMRGTWPSGEHGIVPGVLGRPVDRTAAMPVRLSALQTTHPALAAFNEVDGGDLASAQVYRYRELSGVAADATIARYNDGAVALAERRVGRGRVLVFTTTLDPYWNTLPMQPGYLRPRDAEISRRLCARSRGVRGRRRRRPRALRQGTSRLRHGSRGLGARCGVADKDAVRCAATRRRCRTPSRARILRGTCERQRRAQPGVCREPPERRIKACASGDRCVLGGDYELRSGSRAGKPRGGASRGICVAERDLVVRAARRRVVARSGNLGV